MAYTKEQLQDLHEIELKSICKKLKIVCSGKKNQIIKRIIDESTPNDYKPVVVNYPLSVAPLGKKWVGVALDDIEKSVKMGKIVEQGKSNFLFYSMKVRYYEVNRDVEI
jgi:hypothetical protein